MSDRCDGGEVRQLRKLVNRLEGEVLMAKRQMSEIDSMIHCDHLDMGGFDKSSFSFSGPQGRAAKDIKRITMRVLNRGKNPNGRM